MNKFSKKVVMLVITMNAIFAAAVLALFWHVGTEPAALVTAWFAFTTGELWALAGIKREETRQAQGKEAQNENREI